MAHWPPSLFGFQRPVTVRGTSKGIMWVSSRGFPCNTVSSIHAQPIMDSWVRERQKQSDLSAGNILRAAGTHIFSLLCQQRRGCLSRPWGPPPQRSPSHEKQSPGRKWTWTPYIDTVFIIITISTVHHHRIVTQPFTSLLSTFTSFILVSLFKGLETGKEFFNF